MASIDDLELARAAFESRNLGAVARSRHVSQSTVSRAVQRVEAEIGPLFVREGRSVRPVDGAERRMELVRSMLATWGELRAAGGAVEPRPALAIFCTVTASQTIAPDLLRRFRSRHPGVAVKLRTGPASQALDAARTGEVDAAIAPLPDRLPAAMASILLAESPFVVVRADDTDVDWSNPRLVVPRSGLTRSIIEHWCRSVLRGAWMLQETDTHEEAVALAAVGSGMAVVPSLVLEASPLRPHLRVVRTPRPMPMLRIGLVARRARTSVPGSPLEALWALSGGHRR